MSVNNFLIYDGAMGTVLYSKGLMSECNELLNLTNPDIIESIHREYIDAGSEYIKTNTFGANLLKLNKSGNGDLCREINRAAVEIARSAGAKVCGDIGPSGEIYAPYGNATCDEIYNSYLIQAQALKGSDMILIETMSSLVEAKLAYLAVRKALDDIPVIISFTYSGNYTLMGSTPELIAKAFDSTDIYAIGTNCSGGPGELLSVVKAYRELSGKRISAMPNAGLPSLVDGKECYPFSPDAFALSMKEILHSGASIIGGCCGTTPAHIKALFNIDYDGINVDKSASLNKRYIANERYFSDIAGAVTVNPADDEIIAVEEKGLAARIDVSGIKDLKGYLDNLSFLSPYPKCFFAKPEQFETIEINYQALTDIIAN
ncbi:MAG: homocysteine S-methyltransferase family protein [Christensenellales bacterium]